MYSLAVNPEGIPKQDRTEFLALLGDAIIHWSFVETALGELYCNTTGAHGIALNPFHQSITLSYFSVVSFEARLAMNTAALSQTVGISDPILQEWKTLADKTFRKYHIRSNLAHASLYGDGNKKPGRKIWLSPRPPIYGLQRGLGKSGKPKQYFARDLKNFVGDFSSLRNEIGRFDSKVFRAMLPE